MSAFHPHDPAYAVWSKRYAEAHAFYDKQTVRAVRMDCPFFKPLSIVWNQLCQKWFIQRDMTCIAAWQLKSRSPFKES